MASNFVQQLRLLKEIQAYYTNHVNPVTGAPITTPIISQPPKVFPPAPHMPGDT